VKLLRVIGVPNSAYRSVRNHPTTEAFVYRKSREDPAKPTIQWSCGHCHSDGHEGRQGACPMKDFNLKVACKIVKEAGCLLKTDPMALKRLVQAERANKLME
jgi:hypothetical protein